MHFNFTVNIMYLFSSTLDTVNFLGISIVGQSNKGGDGGIYVGSIMKGYDFLVLILLNYFLIEF